jgi:hypothetical protein
VSATLALIVWYRKSLQSQIETLATAGSGLRKASGREGDRAAATVAAENVMTASGLGVRALHKRPSPAPEFDARATEALFAYAEAASVLTKARKNKADLASLTPEQFHETVAAVAGAQAQLRQLSADFLAGM